MGLEIHPANREQTPHIVPVDCYSNQQNIIAAYYPVALYCSGQIQMRLAELS
jgi:hypothetical protein